MAALTSGTKHLQENMNDSQKVEKYSFHIVAKQKTSSTNLHQMKILPIKPCFQEPSELREFYNKDTAVKSHFQVINSNFNTLTSI